MIKPVKIGRFQVGPDQKCFVVAEAGVNHNGDMVLAKELIDASASAGADAVKFQAFVTSELVTAKALSAAYQTRSAPGAENQAAILKDLELSPDQQAQLAEYAAKVGIMYLCTPYDAASTDMLAQMNVPAFKIASTDNNNIPLLRYIAGKNKPVIMSTGLASMGEIEVSLAELQGAGLADRIVLLHCVAEYPAPPSDANLRAITTLRSVFNVPVGFSDHTPGVGVSPWAVVLGACCIEKHFTLDRNLPGIDHKASLEPDELAELVTVVQQVQAALGDGVKRLMPSEAANKPVMQKSLVAACDIKPGEKITAQHLTCKRPATGLSPGWYDKVVGRVACRAMSRDDFITLDSIDWSDEPTQD